MKRITALLIALLLLTACGAVPEPAAPAEYTEAPLPAAQESPSKDDTQGEEEQMRIEETGKDTLVVTLDGVSSYLRLTLPEGWTYSDGENGVDRKSFVLKPPTDDGFQLEMIRWREFGICGTGVDFRKIELACGLQATLATEENSGYLWWTLILPPSPDQFTLQFGGEQELFNAHRDEIDAILDSLQIGVLAEPQAVQQPRDSF